MAERRNLLADPDFLARASASDVLANALNDPDFRKMGAVAFSEGNDIADEGTFISDLETLGYYDLDAKYGREVADNRSKFHRELQDQVKIRDAKPSIGDNIVDAGLVAGSAITGLIGGLSVAGVGLVGAGVKAVTGNTGVSQLSADMGALLGDITAGITSGQSDTLIAKSELDAIEAELDQSDSTDRMNAKIAAGASPTVSNYERIGEDFLNFGDRFYKDPFVAANLIEGALGSLWPSAKLAQGGVILAEKLAARIGNKFVKKGAAVVGSSIGIGVSESSGTFTDTSAFVMGLSEEDMQNSPEYRVLRLEGKTHEQAQRAVAVSTATEAAARQLPTAAILGLVAAKFNANPFKAFKGQSTVGYFREVGLQTLEEGAQGFSGILNKSLAVRRQVDEDTDIGAGLGAGLGEGIFAGAGMAGVIGAPSQVRVAAYGAAVGGIAAADLISRGVVRALESDVAGVFGEKALGALDATQAAAQKVVKKIEPITKPVAKVVVKGAKIVDKAVVKPALQRVEDFNEKPNVKLQLEVLEASGKAVDLAPDNEVIGAVDKLIIDLATTQASKMSDEEIVEAYRAIYNLRNEVPKLKETNADATIEVLKMLTSSEFLKIRKRFTAIRQAQAEAAPDLNQTQTAETEVTTESIKETVEVAALDPAKVNPDHAVKILKMEDNGLTDEQVVLLEVAIDIARVVSNHQGEQVKVSSRKSIALSTKPDYKDKGAPKVLDIESASRSIQVADFVDEKGTKLRSINTFGADIIEAIQSPDGTVPDLNSDEGTITTEGLIKSFEMFVEHMRNKVGALNTSLSNQDKKGNGSNVMFRSLVGGVRMIAAGVAGGAAAVYVNTNSPKSIATAEAVANDAKVAAEVYNILVRKFPDRFPGGEVTIPTLNPLPTTTVVEGSEAKTSTEAPAEVVVDKEETEQAEVETSTKEEDKARLKLNDELRDLKKKQVILREEKDAAADKGLQPFDLNPFFDRIDANNAAIKAKEDEITALHEAQREARNTAAVDETISPPAQIDEEAGTQTKEEIKLSNERESLVKELTFPQLTEKRRKQINKLIDEINEQLGETQTKKEADDGKARDTQETKTEEIDQSNQISDEEIEIQDEEDPSLDSPPTKKFGETFIQGNNEDLGYADGDQLLGLLNEGTNTTAGYMTFANQIFQKLIDGMNKRLSDIKVSRGDGRSLKQAILDGDTQSHIRNFKNTMLVNPDTGEYNPELLSIAVVAMIDWMSSVRSADPDSKQLRKTLQKLGVNIHDLNQEDMHNILHGVSPRFVAEIISKRIMKMWNVKVNKKGRMVDARGAAEGLVKEMLEVIEEQFDYIELKEIPTKFKKKNGEVVTTPTIVVKKLGKVQRKMGLMGRDSIQRLLSPEEDNGPSIGKRIEHVAKMNRRGTAKLSRKERRALRNQQDVPHTLSNGITSLIGVMGLETYKKMRGYQKVDHLMKNHPLRNSIEGKNLSIERDWEDAHSVTAELQGDKQDTQVFFRVSITKAGRHQHTGINSQNNTTLRVMVSSTSETLDMTDQDHINGFWLTVAQASKLFKVENVLHEKILAEIQGKFAEEFGEAQAIIEEYLKTGELDSNALFEATGEISMEQLNAIYGVADLKYQSRSTNALTNFHTTLGFELDGKTDGPSHMMNNFGQGLLTVADYLNFKRVGMFLGTTKETLNSFFSLENMKDLYNEASVKGMNMMYSEMAYADEATKATLFASSRFAERFGDFTLGDDGLPEMTRDTLKNPMTKTVYGSGLASVARGLAEDMVMGFYKKAVLMPKGRDPAEYFGYPDFEADFALLFKSEYPKGIDWTKNKIDKGSMDHFADIITMGLGEMIASSAKEVIGEPITKVADLLVFITNVQTEFMRLLYRKEMDAMAEKRASQKEGTEGWIGRNKQGKGIIEHLSVEDFKEVEDKVGLYGPTYDNGVQTLALGSMSPQQGNQEFSATMRDTLRVKSTVPQPDDARVKVIPYLTQGRGDAMVVNTIFGEVNPPEDMFAVHDGFYVPISKIKPYSRLVNKAVMEVWDRDVIGDTVDDFSGFVKLVSSEGNIALIKRAFRTVKKKPFDTTVEAESVNDLMLTLKNYHAGNQVRKTVFKEIPLGVDHLGGAEEGATRNENLDDMDRNDINDKIGALMGLSQQTLDLAALDDDPVRAEEDREMAADTRKKAADNMKAIMERDAKKDNTEINIPEGVVISNTDDILDRLELSSKRLTIKKAVVALRQLLGGQKLKVIMGGLQSDLIKYYEDVNGEGSAKRDGVDKNISGWVDMDNNVMYIVSNNHETLVHEMIHLATYKTVLAHYEGVKTNTAVSRLEQLMKQFMGLDYSDKGPALRRAVNAAKAAILVHQTTNNPIDKASALNEFMAWTLSNAALTKDLETRDSVLTKIIDTVKKLMQHMFTGNRIPTDMYSHILFNTVLMHPRWAQIQTEGETGGVIEGNRKPSAADRVRKDRADRIQKDQQKRKDEQIADRAEPTLRDDNPLVSTEATDEELASDLSIREANIKRRDAKIIKEIPGETTSEIERRREAKISDFLDADDITPPTVGDGGNTNGVDNDNNGSNGDDGGRGNDDGGVTPQAASKTNFWIDLMRKKLSEIIDLSDSDPDKGPRVDQFRRYRNAALNALIRLDFGGFILSEYEKHTFRSIHMVLATEMRLNVQSSIALNQMFSHITETLKPEMLGKGKQGQELYSVVMDLLGDTKNDEGVTDAMAVLLALSQTSKVFRAALDEIPKPGEEKVIDGSLNAFLTGITGMMMNKALGTINIADSGAKELLDVLADNLIREDTEREYTLLRALMGSLDKADKFMGGALNQLAERAAAVDTRMKKEDRALLTRLVTSTFALSTAFLSADRASILAKGAKRVTHIGVALDHAVFLREFVTEVIGADSTNAEVMRMLDITNYAIQAIRQNYKEQLPVIMQNAFEVHPSEEEWAAFHGVLAGLDFAHLFDVSNPERAFNLIKDASLLSSKTVDAEAVITSHFDKATAKNILEKSKQLAGYMNGKGAGFQLLHNAHAINKLAGKFDENMTDAIDTLISLYALESANQAQKDIIITKYGDDPKAIQNLVTYIQALNKEEDLKVVSEGARMQGRKGWIPNHGKKNAQIVIQRDDLGDEMIKMGYTRVGDVTADADFSTVKRGYYTTTVKQGTAYSQGVLQSVQGTYRGVNAVTGISVAPDVSGVITGPVLAQITSHLNAVGKVTDDKEVLSPVHDENGEVWAYERIINPEMMAKHIQPKANLALMLGAWAGRQVEEKLASHYNGELIRELKRIWDERDINDDGLFVDISDPKIKDEVFKESWRVISPDTRRQIEAIFGTGKGFMVQKSMMNLALGHSDPTVLDFWTGKTRMPKAMQKVVQAGAKAVMGNKAVTIMSRGEEGIQGAVSKAKDIIVVRSLIVPYMNTQANVVQLLTRGVPLKAMKEGYVDKMSELEQFNENTNRLMEIQTNIALAGNDKNQVRILEGQAQVIEDENKRMSIAPLIEAGQYKNISEGITELDVELTSGRMAEWIENQVNKLPSKLQTITKYGLLSKDTAVYKFANKAVQYGDFLAKAIYYDHLTQVKGLDGEAALKLIQEEYVNFSILPGRTRSALEAVGGTWFMSFKIRTMKVALNVMRENPARALILMGTGIGEFGSPTNDNLGTVILQEGRFNYAIGWTMLLGAPEMNPWAQLWGWT